jgi:Fe-S cluster assembly iron-binding protein IscA
MALVTLTRRARERLQSLHEKARGAGTALRLVPAAPGTLGLVADTRRLGDHTVEHEDVILLVIEEGFARLLAGLVIDCKETAEGPRLLLIRPARATSV